MFLNCVIRDHDIYKHLFCNHFSSLYSLPILLYQSFYQYFIVSKIRKTWMFPLLCRDLKKNSVYFDSLFSCTDFSVYFR